MHQKEKRMGCLVSEGKRAKEIILMNTEDGGPNVSVTYLVKYDDSSEGTVRRYVRSLNSYSLYKSAWSTLKVVGAEFIDKAYCGILKNDVRLIFVAHLSDGSVDLIQVREADSGCGELLALSQKGVDGYSESAAVAQGEVDREAPQTCGISRIAKEVNIPIEVLPNLYSVTLSNVAIKHHRSFRDGKLDFEYADLKCKVNYSLNGRKEGKRKVIFTSYDQNDKIIEIRGDREEYKFTAAGHEFVEVTFNEYGKQPVKRITVSVKEI